MILLTLRKIFICIFPKKELLFLKRLKSGKFEQLCIKFVVDVDFSVEIFLKLEIIQLTAMKKFSSFFKIAVSLGG